jgi:hypothetical protein
MIYDCTKIVRANSATITRGAATVREQDGWASPEGGVAEVGNKHSGRGASIGGGQAFRGGGARGMGIELYSGRRQGSMGSI